MKYVTKQFEAKSWQAFVNYALTHCPDVLKVLRDRRGRPVYSELTKTHFIPASEALRISVWEISWPTRVKTVFLRLGIQTLGDLVTKSKKDLRVQNFGQKSMQAVMDVLDRYGLTLRVPVDSKES